MVLNICATSSTRNSILIQQNRWRTSIDLVCYLCCFFYMVTMWKLRITFSCLWCVYVYMIINLKNDKYYLFVLNRSFYSLNDRWNYLNRATTHHTFKYNHFERKKKRHNNHYKNWMNNNKNTYQHLLITNWIIIIVYVALVKLNKSKQSRW